MLAPQCNLEKSNSPAGNQSSKAKWLNILKCLLMVEKVP